MANAEGDEKYTKRTPKELKRGPSATITQRNSSAGLLPLLPVSHLLLPRKTQNQIKNLVEVFQKKKREKGAFHSLSNYFDLAPLDMNSMWILRSCSLIRLAF